MSFSSSTPEVRRRRPGANGRGNHLGSGVKEGSSQFVGRDPKLAEIFKLVSLVADSDATVLIVGETGTGKELIAWEILRQSSRRDRPFVAVNCAAVSETLQESEMFGHVRGAFTGADCRTAGRFEAADGGTLFLDEISEMNRMMQVKLLRVLQTGEYTPVGTTTAHTCDVRLIAASNRNLEEMVAQREFRKDLYYRLNIICLEIPALRDRRGDVPLLVDHFLDYFRRVYHKQNLEVDAEVLRLLVNYHFPGNVRELENIMMRAVILCQGPRVKVEHLPPQITRQLSDSTSEPLTRFHEAKAVAVEEFEREFLADALRRCGGLINRAARGVGLSERNFHAKMKRYGMSGSAFRAGPPPEAPRPARAIRQKARHVP